MLLIRQQSGSAAGYLAGVIRGQLAAGHKVLWFVSGGSAINLAVSARRLLGDLDLGNLSLMLIDERYGPENHPDSNWRQLKDSGFDFAGLTALPLLHGLPIEETTVRFQEELSQHFKQADFSIALMGIGADGHTSGILPNSPALDAPGLATHYKGPDYLRITTTARALAQLNEALVSLSDEKKRPLIDQLQEELPARQMPAQLLKNLPRFIVFNDWIGEKI